MADVGLFDNKINMNGKHDKRGQWIGFFYLTLSDISAETLNRQCPSYEMKTPNRGNVDKRRTGQVR